MEHAQGRGRSLLVPHATDCDYVDLDAIFGSRRVQPDADVKTAGR
jgi:hypothetical protein